MEKSDILELGHPAFDLVIQPLKELPKTGIPYVGWDTEYDSKTGAFVCFQLWGPNGGRLFTDKMSVDRLARACRQLGIEGEAVFLVSYFSIAEMQFLPVVGGSTNWKLFGNGSLDATFHSDRYSLDLHTFDLARFFDKQSLASVATSFGMRKLDFDTTRVSTKSLRSAQFRTYALHDARLCFDILGELRTSLHGPDPLVHRTAPGCAAALFRHAYLKRKLVPPPARHRLMAMLGCWGGRAEAFARGEFPRLLEYDLRSAYPRAAISLAELPIASSWYTLNNRTFRSGGSIGGFGRFRFRFPSECRYPCLPILCRGVQLYPLAGETFCTLAEARLAVKLGAKVELVEGYGYASGSTVLADYMTEILGERERATGARKVALKLLANALIGKLAQRVVGIDVEALRKLALESGIPISKLARLTIQEAKAFGVDVDPRIGAVFYPEWQGLITGHVRAQISEAAALTGALYVATDAVWVPKPWRGVPDDFTLKREGPGVVARTRLGAIWTPGAHHVVHHGIWRRDVAEILLGGSLDTEQSYTVERPSKLKQSLRKGNDYGKWQEYERVASAHWDGKRILNTDGSTAPWADVDSFEAGSAIARKARRATVRARGRKNDK